MTAKKKTEFEAEIFPLLDNIDAALPDGNIALFALAIALGDRIAKENADPEQRLACFDVMMEIVKAGVEEE